MELAHPELYKGLDRIRDSCDKTGVTHPRDVSLVIRTVLNFYLREKELPVLPSPAQSKRIERK